MYTIQHTLYLPYNDCIICNICMRHCIPCFIFIPYYYSLISPTSLQVIFLFGFFPFWSFILEEYSNQTKRVERLNVRWRKDKIKIKNRIITLKKNTIIQMACFAIKCLRCCSCRLPLLLACYYYAAASKQQH